MTEEKTRCCEMVHSGPHTVTFHRCYNAAKHVHEGKSYCTQQYPPNVQKRSEESTRRWQEKHNREMKLLYRSAMFKELVSALREFVPPMPPVDAPCHLGSYKQAQCAYCQRVARAHDLLKKAEKYE